MNKIRNTKGITLISLVVTIIILLILAGISIATLMGDNGLINRANDAKIATEIASIKEEIQTDILSEQAGNNGNISDDTLKGILEKYGILSEEEKLIDKTLTTTKGNHEIKVADIFNGTTVKDVPKNPTFTTVANAPDTSRFNTSNTYYVAWDLTSSPYTIQESNNLTQTAPSNWYDYTAGENKWANVKTTGGGNDCYWVWIPRYAYKVPTKGDTAKTIEVKFLQGKTNKPIGKTTEITNTTPTPGTWVVHPAFTDAGNGGFGELTGIWVAKFEASSNASNVVENPTESQLAIDGGSATDTELKVRVKPNVTSWRNITVGNIFTVCRNLTTSENSLEGTTGINSHMMKNTEWGAIAYLSMSVYGKNGEVWNNPYYNNTTNYSPITGLCSNETDGKDKGMTDITKTCKYNEAGGGNASTTGNVYGVYDMAGGAWEYVAGILSSYKSNSGNYDFTNSATYPNKYFDWYAGSSSDRDTNYNANTNKYGDAVYETSSFGGSDTDSWDSSCSNFPYSDVPVFIRGGRAYNGSYAGVFAFNFYTGEASTDTSFRPCLVSLQ